MTVRNCECPAFNSDCAHPTCPRYPQQGHLAEAVATAEQGVAALDYAETALSEAWIVLRDIAAGHKYPARYAANLLRAHGHNLDGDRPVPNPPEEHPCT